MIKRSSFLTPRRLLVPGLILVAGVTIAWWSARVQVEQTDAVRRFVTALCLDVVAGAPPSSLETLPPLDPDTVQRRLEAACAELSAAPDPAAALRVQVARGAPGLGGQGDKDAYTAVIAVDGRARLVLFVRPEGDRLTIAGYSEPVPADPEGDA